MSNTFTFDNKDNNVTIKLSTDEKLRDNKLKMPEIEDAVIRFNKVNNDIILDYDYCLNDDDTVELYVLFKHCLSKFGVGQKYANYHIKKERNSIKFTKITTKPPKKVPANVEQLNITNLKLNYNIVENIKSCIIEYKIIDIADDFKYHNMIESLLKIIFTNFMKEFGQELLCYIEKNTDKL